MSNSFCNFYVCVTVIFILFFFTPKIRNTPIQRRVLNYASETISSRLNISRFIVGSLPLLSYDGKTRQNANSLKQLKVITVAVVKNYFRKIPLYQSVWEKKR